MYRKQPQQQWIVKSGVTIAITLCLTLSSNIFANTVRHNALIKSKKTEHKINNQHRSKFQSGSTSSNNSQKITVLVDNTAQNNATYAYDELGRLSKIMLNGKLITEYQYDAVGNRTQKQHHQ